MLIRALVIVAWLGWIPSALAGEARVVPSKSPVTRIAQSLGLASETQSTQDSVRVMTSVTSYPGDSIVLIEGDGSPRDPDTQRRLTDAQFEAHLNGILRGIHDRFPAETDTVHLLIYVHGGLNTFDGALEKARDLAGELRSSVGSPYYPLAVVWSSNLATGLKDQALRDRLEVTPRWSENFIGTPVFAVTTVARGVVGSFGTMTRQLRQDLRTTFPGRSRVDRYTTAVYDSLVARQQTHLLAAHGAGTGTGNVIRVSWPQDDDFGFWRRTGRFLLYLRTLPLTFGTSWVVAEPGNEAWHSMRGRSQNVFRQPREFQAHGGRELQALEADPVGSGGLSRYLEGLAQGLDLSRTRITLVGHSMGTIILNRILERWPDLPYERIIYMAAACSVRDFEQSAIPVLQSHPDLEFYNLSLDPGNEMREINFGDLPQRGSLLTWIDNFYTQPETYLDNTLGRWEVALAASRIFPDSVRDQVNLRAFGVGRVEPTRSVSRFAEYEPGAVGPQRHGDFSGYRFWDPEFYEPEIEDPTTMLPPRRTRNGSAQSWVVGRVGYGAAHLFEDRAELASLAVGFRGEGGNEIAAGYRRLRERIVERDRGDGFGPESLRLQEFGAHLDFVEGFLSSETFLGYGRADWEGARNRPGDPHATYFVVEPTSSLHLVGPVWVGGGWRWTWGADSDRFSNAGMSGWVLQARLAFQR